MTREGKDVKPPGQPSLKDGHPRGPRRLYSTDLFEGARALIIVHNEEEYHLRITRLGKLILTK
jgi:hemin uptake protein HemP